MIAIEAPVEASCPYADGKTTVLSPKGVAKANKHIFMMSESTLSRYKANRKTIGKSINLNKVAR